ncbi:MAG: hypothetical protein PHC69_05835 [Ruminiclostridium sp.]|nr:hypothetical protein [Ruminiclostridium sp.]
MRKRFYFIFLVFFYLTLFISACSAEVNAGRKVETEQSIATTSSNQTETKVIGKEIIQTDVKLITDINTWNHSVKDILVEHPFDLTKLELYNNGVYPVFYVSYPRKNIYIEEEDYMMELFNKIAASNGYWDYELRNEEDGVIVKVVCERQSKLIKEVFINGDKDYFENLKKERDQPFNLFLKNIQEDSELNILTRGDIDKDGLTEFIVLFEEKYYAARKRNGIYEKIDFIRDCYPVVGVEIMQLDKTGDYYMVFDTQINSRAGVGFSIYKLVDGRVLHINTNMPYETGAGFREVADINLDGIYEDVSVYYFTDTQNHEITMYRKFDGTGQFSYQVSYNNQEKRFVYPETANAVIKNYIEDMFNREALKDEIEQLVVDKKLIDFKIGKYVDFSGMFYYGVDLNLVTVSGGDTVKKIKQDSLLFTVVKVDDKWKISSINIEQ